MKQNENFLFSITVNDIHLKKALYSKIVEQGWIFVIGKANTFLFNNNERVSLVERKDAPSYDNHLLPRDWEQACELIEKYGAKSKSNRGKEEGN